VIRIAVIALVLVNMLLLAVQVLRQPEPEDASAAPAPEQASESTVPTIHLLSELPGAADLAQGTTECFSAGPFLSISEREAALDQVAGSALSIRQRETEATIDSGTWVFLPVQPDRETARNMALTMRDAGLGEVEVVGAGEWEDSVSLGFYVNHGFALERQAEARSLGFPVEVRKQQKVQPRYWLDYEQRVGAPYVVPDVNAPIKPDAHRLIACGPARAEPAP
jgi:hypothetical protein